MRVDGRSLVEANAILTHLANRKPELGLLPERGTWNRDLAGQWLAYLASGFHAAFWPYFMPKRYTTDEAHYGSVKAAALLAIRRELTLVDAHLAGRDCLLGDRRTVLDAYLQAMDRWANPIVDMANEFPNVWRHQKRFAGDPAVRFANAVEKSPDAASTSSTCLGHVPLEQVV
jgi:glutathione S-transferase